MKKIFSILFLFSAVFLRAQVINIPDAGLLNALVSASASNSIALNSGGNPVVVDTNGDGLIQVSEAAGIEELYLSNQGIYNMEGVQYFTELRTLECGGNLFNSLDVSGLPELRILNCQLSTGLTSLNVAGMTSLRELYCNNCQLSVLDLSGLEDLRNLDCSYNNISSLSLTGLDHLQEMVCANNQLTVLSFSGLEYLQSFNGNNNYLTALDFSNCPQFDVLQCANNNITNIILKNGAVQSAISGENDWGNNPLTYICGDEDELTIIEDQLVLDGYSNISVNTFCSFTPGGSYNTITSTIISDSNGDGCNSYDLPQCFMKVMLSDGSYTFTNMYGSYDFYTQDGNYTVTPQFENNSFFSVYPPSASVNFATVDGSVAGQDFCVSAVGSSNDLEVVMVPVTKAVPGMPADYKIVYKNKGNTTLFGTVNCNWDTSQFSAVSNINPPTSYVGTNNYQWSFYDLKPFENREITMTLTLNNSGSGNPVYVGDNIPFAVTITSYLDQQPTDNSFDLGQDVESAYQDNFIQCLEGETLSPDYIGEYLHYHIYFTNTGTTTAENVVISQDLDPAQFDISTLEILNTSHEATARIVGDNVKFLMEGANVTSGNGHGNVLFKVKTRDGLLANSQVSGQARIYYDYALPKETNEATSVFGVAGVDEVIHDTSVKIYPNPASSVVNISAEDAIETVQLYDVQGRLLQSDIVNINRATINLSSRTTGVYFVKVTTAKGTTTQKIVKQ